MWLYLILIAVAIFLYFYISRKFKFPKIGAIAVFVGGVKSGKSAVSVACAISNWKKEHRRWKIKSFFIKLINKLFRRKKEPFALPEEPLLYSSIPLRYVPYVPLTREHLIRKVRFNYRSIVFLDEASLIADSQLIKDKDINTELLLFFKLFGHETHGGKCIINSHCISDLHYALKRTTSQYFYLHHLSSWIPFFSLAHMREERFSEDGTTLNVFNEDVEESLKKVIFRKSIFKKYDSFCFSVLTDHKPLDNNVITRDKYDSLKADRLPSFRPEFYNLNFVNQIQKEFKEVENEKKDV